MSKIILFYETLFPYQIQVGMPALSVGGCVGGGGGMAEEISHCSIIKTILQYFGWKHCVGSSSGAI